MSRLHTPMEELLGQTYLLVNETFETWEEAVDDWVIVASPEERREAVAQLNELIPTADESRDFSLRLWSLGCEINPRDEENGYGYKEWLIDVRDRVIQGLAGE